MVVLVLVVIPLVLLFLCGVFVAGNKFLTKSCQEFWRNSDGVYLNSLYRESLYEDPEPVEKRS
jgi:hypothetical protein